MYYAAIIPKRTKVNIVLYKAQFRTRKSLIIKRDIR